MKFSIITVNLNNLPGLKQTMESVFIQTYTDFEYIVVDGASTDGSVDFIRKYATQLTKWISEADSGIYQAMNKGIRLAQGEYLLFLNSGDTLANENILDQASDQINGEGIAYGDLFLVDADGKKERKEYPDELNWDYVWDHSLPHPASFIRRDLFSMAGMYNEKDRITSDWQFFMLVLFYLNIEYLHLDFEVAIFRTDGICNDPANFTETQLEKNQFKIWWKTLHSRKILLVGMADSIHLVRALEQMRNSGFRFFLFPSYDINNFHIELPDFIKVCIPFSGLHSVLMALGKEHYYWKLNRLWTKILKRLDSNYYSKRLERLIISCKPDLVHSLETQGAGYLLSSLRADLSKKGLFPKWWHTNYGSDIYLFGKIENHVEKIKAVMTHCDYYSCECERDIQLARDFGFNGQSFPVLPNAGGFKQEDIDRLRGGTRKPSQRRVIMLKGHQGWAGRALVGLRAIERSAEILKGYKVVVFSNALNDDIQIAVNLLRRNKNIEIELLPEFSPHQEILRYHSLARLSIGLSICDGISTSLLEAMAMGSFPIQSNTACAEEWIEHGRTGFIVTPEDSDKVEEAIRKAIEDDNLVDRASEINEQIIRNRLDQKKMAVGSRSNYLSILRSVS